MKKEGKKKKKRKGRRKERNNIDRRKKISRRYKEAWLAGTSGPPRSILVDNISTLA